MRHCKNRKQFYYTYELGESGNVTHAIKSKLRAFKPRENGHKVVFIMYPRVLSFGHVAAVWFYHSHK